MSASGLRRLRWCLALALLSAAAAKVHAAGEHRTAEFESLRVTVDTEWPGGVAPGYVPIRVDITNLGEARTIELYARSARMFGAGRGMATSGMDLRRDVRLNRGDRVRVTLPVPVIAENENVLLQIVENGRTIQRFGYGNYRVSHPAGHAGAVIVADPSSAFAPVATGWVRRMIVRGTTIVGSSTGSGAGGRSAPPLDLLLAPDRLPSNWLGYTSLRAVVIGPGTWKQMDEEQRSAVLTWTAAGGDLLLVDTSLGELFPSPGDPLGRSPAPPVRGYFFGRIHSLTPASFAGHGLAGVLTETESLGDASFALPANRPADWNSIAARGFRLPIAGIEGVRARSYLFIVIMFSLLIGPVNYWVLWRKRQQVLFMLTAPVISIAFIVLLAAYVLAAEGTGVHGRAVTFTVLDEVRRQAVTRASVSMYSPGLTPSEGLRFGRDTAIIPIGTDGRGSRERLVVDLNESQRLASGAIQARSPANLELILSRTARERLAFNRESSGIAVVNGLDTPVLTLLYRSGGQIYSLDTPLAAGQRAVLKPGGLGPAEVVPEGLPLSWRFRHLIEHQPEGSYLAVLERSPFWEPGTSRMAETGSFHFVIGWPGGQP